MSLHIHPHVNFTEDELVCLENCGTYTQYHHMRSHFENRTCPFCRIDPSVNTIILAHEHWTVVENAFKNDRSCSTMLVIISRRHVRHFRDLTEAEWKSLGTDILLGCHEKMAEAGGMLFARFGNMAMNEGSVPHLHFNLWIPDGTGEVRIPLFKGGDTRAKARQRAADFATRYLAGETP
jgi:diadenosine tetraphosphate (Ap4A) HIT family hydrolase